ncbi:uncharacterized protein TNIN_299212 [Trichonephila inaurata madagascariensis]|uniref:DUF5641 domain-containing protein n=1 Tax=Trichonephila inaurata madagascariensis TaxID=2747483 RepID=A0A8X6Y2W5_9ARAC|nr:uncharacterized protein TNIN_299212 [Trichonephila inaurata madagascariensis]
MDAETATVLRGRAKAALTRTKYFIDKDDQTFDKNDIRNKLEKLELTYTEFDKADAALPIESSEMKEFETKYYETKAKLQNILENLSMRTNVYANSDVFENVSNIQSSNFKCDVLSVPEELPSTSNHRDRWELLQNLKRGFWKKWSSDFLSSLQPRKKWQDAQPNLKEDDIVLIKEEGPPGTWPMARVLQGHPGNDGLV